MRSQGSRVLQKRVGTTLKRRLLVEKLRKINPANPAIQQVEALVRTEKRNPQLQEAARLAQAGEAQKAVAIYRSAFGGNTPRLTGRFLITRH